MSIDKYKALNRERTMQHTKKRVAAYCRVSTECEDQANSFESQCLFFKQYIERNPDWELYEIFADSGISGTNTKKRKEFNRMISCAKSGQLDLILTKEISRFARNTLDSIYYTRDLKKYGVGVIFMNDNINTLDGDAELRLSIMASIAQEESRRTSERVKWGQKRQMEQGVVFGRSMLGYDIKGGKMYINEKGAAIVRLIFHKFVNERKGAYVIARELREAGIAPMRANEWNNTVILRIIRNEKYCGDLVQKKTYTPDFLSHEKKINHGEEEFIIIKDHHTPIIPRALFDKANDILNEKSFSQKGKTKYSNRYLFSGKIKCGICGASYVARYKTRKNGSKYQSWSCLTRVKNGSLHMNRDGSQTGCSGSSIRNEEALYIMYLICRQLDIEREKISHHLIKIMDKVFSMDSTDCKDTWAEQMEMTKKKYSNLIELYTNGDIDRKEFIAFRKKYNAQMDNLKSKIEYSKQQSVVIKNQQKLIENIKSVMDELIRGVLYEDEFYADLLDKMVVGEQDTIDVYLKGISFRWHYIMKRK